MEQSHYSCIHGGTNMIFKDSIKKEVNGKEMNFDVFLPRCSLNNKICIVVTLNDPDDILSLKDSNIQCEYYESNKNKQVKTHTVVVPADPLPILPNEFVNSTNSYIKSNLHNMIKPNRN